MLALTTDLSLVGFLVFQSALSLLSIMLNTYYSHGLARAKRLIGLQSLSLNRQSS
jgi:hypothetical protein